MKLAITHGGASHADETLSAAYLIAKHGVDRIERRDPTAAELADESVIVFDIGGQLDAALNNYDHHQEDRDAPPTCAFTRVLHAFEGSTGAWRAIYPWVEGTEIMDSKGPFAVSAKLGVDFDDLKPFVFCPFAGFILDMFAAQDSHSAGEPAFELLRQLGLHLVGKVEEIVALWQHFDATTQLVDIGDVFGRCSVTVAVFDTTGSKGIESWLASRNMAGVECIVSRDDRGDGLSLFRRGDCKKLDFSRSKILQEVAFAHPNGFVAKTYGQSWQEVVRAAITAA